MKKIGFLLIALMMGTMMSMAQNWQSATPEEMAKKQTADIKDKVLLPRRWQKSKPQILKKNADWTKTRRKKFMT